MAALEPGTPAPSFCLKTEEGEDFTRVDLHGQTTVLVFYPFAFSPVCTQQLSLYEEVLDELRGRAARIFGVSCDSSWSQRAFREHLGVTIPQLSDFEPKGAACRAFGVFHEGGFAQRALVITDPAAVVRFSRVEASPGEMPGVNVLFDALALV